MCSFNISLDVAIQSNFAGSGGKHLFSPTVDDDSMKLLFQVPVLGN
jgi:hypothetical protein